MEITDTCLKNFTKERNKKSCLIFYRNEQKNSLLVMHCYVLLIYNLLLK